MAMKQLDSFTCPNCGGKLEHKGSGFYKCPFCDSEFHDESAPQETESDKKHRDEEDEELKPVTVENIKEIVMDIIFDQLEEVADDTDSLSIGDKPKDHPKLDKACRNFDIPDSAEVWMIWDETFLGGCKYGFAFTSEGIYSNYKENDGLVHFTWEEFYDCDIDHDVYSLCLDDVEFPITGSDAFDPIYDATLDIQDCFEEELDWED